MEQNQGRTPEEASADTGAFQRGGGDRSEVRGIELAVPPDRQKHRPGRKAEPIMAEIDTQAATQPQSELVGECMPPAAKSAAETMRDKLRTTAGRVVYKMRKVVVE